MSTTKLLAATASLLIAAPWLTACGSAEDDAKQTAQDALHALGNFDGDTFCGLTLTEDGAKPLKDDPAAFERCKSRVASFKETDTKGDIAKLKDAKVKKSTIDGDKATVALTDIEGIDDSLKGKMTAGSDPSNLAMHLKKNGGKWYLASQGAATAPTAPASPTKAPASTAPKTAVPSSAPTR